MQCGCKEQKMKKKQKQKKNISALTISFILFNPTTLQQTILIRKTRNKMRVWKIKQIKNNCNENEYKFKCQGQQNQTNNKKKTTKLSINYII